MNPSLIFTILFFLLANLFSASASNPFITHLNIFYTDSLNLPRVYSIEVEENAKISFIAREEPATYGAIMTAEKRIEIDSVSKVLFGTNIPKIQIYTDSLVEEVSSKTEYLSGYLHFNGFGEYEDFDSVPVAIRGRGNSSWRMEKKPYRLKFDKKLPLGGLISAKNFVLINNYIDPTHLRNAMALKLSQLLEMPFANHCVPVNVEFNGIQKGAYMLSEKQGIGKGSVNIDELTGILWELDTNYDEDYKFYSPIYNLPVMLADPDPSEIVPLLNQHDFLSKDNLDKDSEESPQITEESWFYNWKEDFIAMEQSVKAGKTEEVFDMKQLIDYILVFLVTGNNEIIWPKSVKLYKAHMMDKYVFGPVWDFDWAFGYALPAERRLFSQFSPFFYDIVRAPGFIKLFGERWNEFKEVFLPEWLEYLDSYIQVIRVAALQDGEIWTAPDRCSADFDNQVIKLKDWLQRRIALIDEDENYMLF